ncbi:MAG: bifunctional transaldolase/phosoglucose isomerase, partial [Myxococcota bacterium]
MNPLQQLSHLGQSIWLDFLDRNLLNSGLLQQLIEEDDLKGVTSNPTIFERAIEAGSEYYLPAILDFLQQQPQATAQQLYEHLVLDDIQRACDLLQPVYERTQGQDGYVSLEVSPRFAHNAADTLAEGKRLWQAIDRPNLMIKVPGTAAGMRAIRQLIAAGIHVNVTLLFAVSAYEQAAQAYMRGLQDRLDAGQAIDRLASVASFFVSRMDTAVDDQLNGMLKSAGPAQRALLEPLLGKTAIANAKMAYELFQQLHDTQQWQALSSKGAQPQRLLWASTGTKNPAYSDVLYVQQLAGAQTVDTLPMATLDAFRHHGQAQDRLGKEIAQARSVLKALKDESISLSQITDKLLQDGINQFTRSFDNLLTTLQQKIAQVHQHHPNGNMQQACFAADPLYCELQQEPHAQIIRQLLLQLEHWTAKRKVQRLWSKDATLWTSSDEARWMRWLDAAFDPLQQGAQNLAQAKLPDNHTDVVLLGMGGSSLAPEVLADMLGSQAKARLHVLDTTDSAQIERLRQQLDLQKTLFIVSSKSGTTLETQLLRDLFWHAACQQLGSDQAGQHFVAVTDLNTPLHLFARRNSFVGIFVGETGIGGRYSALSPFGLVPAMAMGLQVQQLVRPVESMVQACSHTVAPADNPGVLLGMLIGLFAKQGRNKVTLVTCNQTRLLGAWLEQLLAESTGKQGRGVVPIDGETLLAPEFYGNDRLFVSLCLQQQGQESQTKQQLQQLQQAGHPVVWLDLPNKESVMQQFVLWEIATAVVGSLLQIHPFNQPDVEASKLRSQTLMQQYEQSGALVAPPWSLQEGNIKVLVSSAYSVRTDSLAQLLADYTDLLREDDYFALLAFLPRFDECQTALQRIRQQLQQSKRV